MEEKIEELLEAIYDLRIDVEFVDFRVYKITVVLKNGQAFELIFKIDCRSTIESNVQVLVNKIDNEILKIYKKG